MKKITWSVAALLIAGTTLFGQVTNEDYVKQQEELKSLEYQIEDLIDAIRMDMYYGHLERQRGMYYINGILQVKSRNRDLMAELWKKRNVTLSERYIKLN